MANRYIHYGISTLLIFSLAGFGYAGTILFMQNPCETEKTWSVVSVDPRFGIATSTVISYSKEAANVWNRAYGTSSLLSYRETDGDIKIHLVFDERQRTTLENERIKQTIEKGQDQLDNLKQTIESLRAEYDTLERQIEQRTESYNTKLAKHNNEVAYWNARGGAPTEAYQRLERERASLETERLSLNASITRFNSLAENIRQYGRNHNEVVETINNKIFTLNETAIREFEEGTYDPNTRAITIYEYASTLALKRVLIHELGHALGLDHVEDKEAIMYPINQGKGLTLTSADLEELKNTCRKKDLNDIISLLRLIRDDIFHLAQS